MAEENAQRASELQKEYYDKKTKERHFDPGKKVLIRNYKIIQTPGITNKFSHNYEGPYIIDEKQSDLNYWIIKNKKRQLFHVNRLRHFTENSTFHLENKEEEEETGERGNVKTLEKPSTKHRRICKNSFIDYGFHSLFQLLLSILFNST